MAIVNDLVHLLLRGSWPLREPINLNFLVTIFLDLQLLLPVQQIDYFVTVELVEAHDKGHAGLVKFENVAHGTLRHC